MLQQPTIKGSQLRLTPNPTHGRYKSLQEPELDRGTSNVSDRRTSSKMTFVLESNVKSWHVVKMESKLNTQHTCLETKL